MRELNQNELLQVYGGGGTTDGGETCPPPTKEKGNNGWGNGGDDPAPGNSLNNTENSQYASKLADTER